MITSSIQKQLFQVTPIEQEQINNNGKNVQDVPTIKAVVFNTLTIN